MSIISKVLCIYNSYFFKMTFKENLVLYLLSGVVRLKWRWEFKINKKTK